LKVSSEFLAVLGVTPVVGRGFTADEAAVGGNNHVVLLANQFWQSHYGGDAGVVGRTVSLDQIPHTVIGVLPPRALLQDDAQFLIPEVIDAPGTFWVRGEHWLRVVGRLSPGVTASEAQLELRGIKRQLAAEYPSFKEKWSVAVTPLQEILVGDTRPMLVLLLGAVGLVLLIACANVSNLLLARGNARSREMAVRLALGANSWRVVRQMLTESIMLAMSGCALGLLAATFGIRLLTRMVAEQLPQILHPHLDTTVLAFSVSVACGCGVLFGTLPAWRAANAGVNHSLKEGERASASRSKRRSQSFLVVSEFAFTLVLLVGAGLFLRSFIRLIEIDPGFGLAHNHLGQAYLQKKMYGEAIAELQQAVRLSRGSPTCIANLARAYALSGKRGEAERLLSELKQRSSPGYSHGSEIAAIYVSLGQPDEALSWLEKGYEERFNPGVLLRPGFDPLRSDARFQALVRRVGLPQ
jgi:predicted permease